mmetsp:Transcript_1100/g.2004  ORF Transcript_1100/g.2004 Transcript_1100/m.2004 type:complete len:81 (-) Transcript_1100:394-636(-)|eukprot:CAMPEP_0198283288 /NCGR_PEP_ID=MMETSP1449-20131203/2942_1 /TAXON_ID=420275 /ORGANISM="Attheya septentrionalis, Strain CCMP2084" /LENGTH=80 /DNA_ID=CAMNT_0043979869 /DNA_START=342 /DNA_END=584 /DNA_ORIENTATION=+
MSKRQALEYGILVTLALGLVTANGVLLFEQMAVDEDGRPRKREKIDLRAPLNLGEMWSSVKRFGDFKRFGDDDNNAGGRK